MERSLPACLVEDVEEDVAHEADALANALLVDLVGRGFKGPVDEHGAADDVFPGYESPETAVEAFGAVVSHGEDLAGRNDEIAIDDVVGEFVGPAGSDLIVGARWDSGKVVAISVEGVLGVVVRGWHASLGFVLRNTIKIDDAVAKMDSVAGNTNRALDEEEVRFAGFEEDDDVAAANVAIEGEGSPLRRRGEGDAVNEDVIADEQRLDHGRGGDFEVLEDEGHDEETDGEDGADGGQGLKGGLGTILLGGFDLVCCGCDGVGQKRSPAMQLPVYR